MEEHIHTGFIDFVTVGVYAVIFIWALRIIAGKLVEFEPTETIGKGLAGVVHFGG